MKCALDARCVALVMTRPTTQQHARNTMRNTLQHARSTKVTTTQSNNATQCMQCNTTQQQQHNNNATTCNTTYAMRSPCHDKSCNAMPTNIELHNATTCATLCNCSSLLSSLLLWSTLVMTRPTTRQRIATTLVMTRCATCCDCFWCCHVVSIDISFSWVY